MGITFPCATATAPHHEHTGTGGTPPFHIMGITTPPPQASRTKQIPLEAIGLIDFDIV